jgi:hypothetical protein
MKKRLMDYHDGHSSRLANNYLRKQTSIDDAIDSLIRWQNAKGVTSGFLTGFNYFTCCHSCECSICNLSSN